jgi:hypothetical protein
MRKASKKESYKPGTLEHLVTVGNVTLAFPTVPETAEDILCCLVEDIKSAHGYMPGDDINEEDMAWPDLVDTYKNAVDYLKKHSN